MRKRAELLANFLGATKELTSEYVDLAEITDIELNQIETAMVKRVRREERPKIAHALHKAGFSTRAIAERTGWDHSTIANDLAVEKSTKTVEKSTVRPSLTGGKSETNVSPTERREKALREQLRLAQTKVIVPNKQFGTLVIDPPWPMKKIEREVRPNQVEFDYPTMDYEQLRGFRSTFQDFAADDCHVFMWTTQRFLPMALRLLEDYEVKYVLTMVWHKSGGFQPVGLPQYNCEFVVYGRIGSPSFIDTTAFNCCFQAPRTEHSRKPDEFYDLVRRVTAEGRIDIFSREPREGFEQFGNETNKYSKEAAE